MAIDVYLQIDGIKGESMDDTHKGWIECTSVNWGIHQPRSATASTGGGHTAERAELEEVSFHKIADLASPTLMQTCAMGKTIPKAKFEFMRADGDGKPCNISRSNSKMCSSVASVRVSKRAAC